MQQSTACLHFAWHTTSLRVGGRAARRSCLAGLRRGGGDRQAGATVLSCLVWRQVRSASECVRRSHRQCLRRPTHSDAERSCRADPFHTTTPDTTRRSCLCRVRRCKLSRLDRPTSAFYVGDSECVRRSHQQCMRRPTHSAAERICRTDSVHTSTPYTTRRSCLCRV